MGPQEFILKLPIATAWTSTVVFPHHPSQKAVWTGICSGMSVSHPIQTPELQINYTFTVLLNVPMKIGTGLVN